MAINPTNSFDWLRALGGLVATASMTVEDARERLIIMTPMLEQEFGERVFCGSSLAYAARRCKFFPTFSELCAHLGEWQKENQPPLTAVALADNVVSVSPDARRWIGFWDKRANQGWEPLREPDGRLSRPDIRDWKKHTASLIRQCSPEAWAFIAKREGEGDRETARLRLTEP
jgi:hypothetical protein